MKQTNIVFLNTDNIVIQVVVFDVIPTDMTPFLELQKTANNISSLTYVDGSLYTGDPAIGTELYNETAFREISPYPSWVWDESALEWIPPVLKPTIGNPVGQEAPGFVYDWNEIDMSWDKRVL